ncbi:membrane-bound lytic murein transglycosylase D [Spirosomataceae bacterium TFI 002]|nr:membrane-bound lytic murein transglycosylase D [Spirosomataceae bacterium TFI 002]
MDYSSLENFKKMKKYAILLFTCLAISANSQVQISIPETPKKIEFSNVVINLDEETRKIVDETVNGLLTPPNSFLDAKLERMQWYFPIIERILEEEDVPDDLKYIAVMESSLIPEALSTSSAVGFWQFKKATGEELGLVINNDIDERKYIVASTRAAALYFKRNNLIFKNWISSIYSYNQGPTGAASEIPEEWSYASEVNFTKKTPPYLIKALAHRIAFEHRLNRLKSSPRIFIEYPTESKSLAEIAAELTVDISELRKYNSWLNAATTPEGKLYTVLIPVRREDADEIRSRINQRRDVVKVDVGFPKLTKTSSGTGPDDAVLYNINDKKGILAQPGEEVAQLAKKGKVKIVNFLKFNDMSDRDMVKTGQVYYLQAKGKKAKIQFHTVTSDQTLWDISQMYGIQLKHLLKYNRLSSVQRLQPGRVIWLQKKRPKNTPVEIIKEAIPVEKPEKELPVVTEYNKEKPTPKVETTIIEESTPLIVEEKPIPRKVTPETQKPLIESKVEKKTSVDQESSVFSNSTPTKPVYNNRTENSEKATSVITYNGENKTHRVAKGETLFSISKRYGLTVAELRALNRMTSSDVLLFDQVLNVSKNSQPEVEIVRSSPSNTPTPTNNSSTSYHTVSSGETLFSISNRYGMSVDELKNKNGLSSNTISVGQRLKVSGDTESSQSSTSSAGTHVVKAGETLYSISRQHNTTVGQLKAWNNMTSNTISVGQILEIR